MTEKVKTTFEGGVLSITLDRPEKKNALTPDMYRALTKAFLGADGSGEIRVVLLAGARDCFCAGNDLAGFEQAKDADYEDPGLAFMETLIRFGKPVVAAVNGPAIGLGATLLLHCDLVYGARNSFFQMPFVDLGLCPEAASTFLLPRAIGYQRTAALLMLGERCDGEQWRDYGLLTELIEVDDCRTYAKQKALSLAAKPSEALMVTRRLMRRGREMCLDVSQEETEYMRKLLRDTALRMGR